MTIATSPLHPGTLLCCRQGVSKQALSELLHTQHHFMLPYGNILRNDDSTILGQHNHLSCVRKLLCHI